MNLLLAAIVAVSIDTDGMLLINGQRTFMAGLYDFPKIAEPWKAAQAAGFNLIRVAPKPEPLRLARAHGLYAWSGTGALNATNAPAIRKTVESILTEPALIMWETEDEPTFVWNKPLEIRTPPQRIIDTRRLIQSIDPSRIFYLNHSPTNLIATLQKYGPGTDAVATDVYPVIPRGIRNQYALWPNGRQGDFLNETISQVGQYADKMRHVAGPSKPVFMVLQGFAWEVIQKQPDPKMILYPTRKQSRFMAYQSIVHGANGVIYWGLHLGPPENPAWQAVRAVTGELKQIAAELAAKPLPASLILEYFETGHSLDRGIAYLLKPSPGGALLIAVNEDGNPVDVAFRKLDGYRSCTALFESRPAALKNGELRDTFAPFTARVYRCAR